MRLSSEDEQVLGLINEAQNVALFAPKAAGVDEVSALLAFYHILIPLRKKVTPIVPEKVPSPCLSLPESAEIKNTLAPKRVIISLDTNKIPLKRVGYDYDGTTFNFTIFPLEENFRIENIRYLRKGDNYQLFFTFGVKKLSDLGPLEKRVREDMAKIPLVNLDVGGENENFGHLNLIDPQSGSLSELLFYKLSHWKLRPNKKAAWCLLTGFSAHHRKLEKESPLLISDSKSPRVSVSPLPSSKGGEKEEKNSKKDRNLSPFPELSSGLEE